MIRLIIKLYILVLIVDAILSYIPQAKGLEFTKYVRRAADYSLVPVRKIIGPHDLPLDPSPLVVIVLLNLLMLLW